MCKSLSEKAQGHLLDILVDMELELPCDEMGDEWCYQNCRYSSPQKECWVRWAETKEE